MYRCRAEKELDIHFLTRWRFLILLGATLALAFGIPDASAQSQSALATPEKTDPPDPAVQGWHVDVAPYLWFAGINGSVGALGHETSAHVSARNVLSYFNFGLMGAVETRYNRVIIPVDFMWVSLKDSKGIPITDDVQSVHTKIDEDILTPKVGYRVVDKSRFKADALFAVRYWHLGTTLTLQPRKYVMVSTGPRTGSMAWRAPDSRCSLRQKPCSQSGAMLAEVGRGWTTRLWGYSATS